MIFVTSHTSHRLLGWCTDGSFSSQAHTHSRTLITCMRSLAQSKQPLSFSFLPPRGSLRFFSVVLLTNCLLRNNARALTLRWSPSLSLPNTAKPSFVLILLLLSSDHYVPLRCCAVPSPSLSLTFSSRCNHLPSQCVYLLLYTHPLSLSLFLDRFPRLFSLSLVHLNSACLLNAVL